VAGRDAAYPTRGSEGEQLLYTRSGAAVQRMALEFDALAADIYWIRAIQHYGGDRLSRGGRGKYELLQPLLDLTTTLDPFFTIAYRFGAIFLSEAPPGGPGRPDQAIALLEKGIAAQPQKAAFPRHRIRAFLAPPRSDHRRDLVPAGRGPARRTHLAPAARGGDAERARPQLGATAVAADPRSDQPRLRRTAERSLLQLQALDQIDGLQAVVAKAGVPAGRRINWVDLVRRGLLPGAPLDPTGTSHPARPRHRTRRHRAVSTLSPLRT
jgi:hypothetical protein